MLLAVRAEPGLELRWEHPPFQEPVVTAAVRSGLARTTRVVAVFGPGIEILERVSRAEAIEAQLKDVAYASAPAVRRIIPHRPWAQEALCRVDQRGDKVWFGNEDGQRPALKRSDMRAARKICGRCPVAAQCLTAALTDENATELYGIWAGTARNRRREMLTAIADGDDDLEGVVTAWVHRLMEGSIPA